MATPYGELALRIYQDASAGVLHPERLGELATIDDGLRAQLGVLELHLAAGDSLVGWKVGLTSGRSRDRMGPGIRPFGHLLRSRTYRSGAVVAVTGRMAIEPELVFQLAHSLRGNPNPTRVASAIESVRPAFELLQYRTPEPVAHPVSAADNLAHWGVVLGDPVAWRSAAADIHMDLWQSRKHVGAAGPGYAIDEPTESIAALCSMLDRFGLGLDAGQYLLTGSFAIAAVEARSVWQAEFSGIGFVEVELNHDGRSLSPVGAGS